MKNGYIVEGDLFDIAARIREIDPDYFVFYNTAANRYEVHHRLQRGSTLALTVPYEKLDERTLRLVRRTRSERAERLMTEAEEHNKRLLRSQVKDAEKRAEKRAEQALSAI